MHTKIYILLYLLLMNLAGFLSMGLDKQKAKKQKMRIPEKTLFLFALLGGSFGSTIGMFYFHHKTRHWYFRLGFPLILLAQLFLLCLYFIYYG